ncbi:dipeptide ABC transporter ATP-binding protein [Dongia soli]|uniref:ABC transporter ATP-binding protein n=1 Tax=Dongia soli TaxID=600628 RepID=A0ABU5EDV2_9PROT|nr:ABC transporter ATP-binding protein [Dongia soli]MDY0884548.1 ABC transporter ATP-binding protein [Dongia soli]
MKGERHMEKQAALLSVADLTVAFGGLTVVKGISFELHPREIIGIVGESGSGKSIACRAVAGLLPSSAVATGRVMLEGRDLMRLDETQWQQVRGRDLGMIFQNPASHLDPLRQIGRQVAAPLIRHQHLGRRDAQERAVELLADVGIRQPEMRVKSYPHEFSGGMKQRAMIAAAIGCGPKLLIADEPTTALDVTVQARILKLLKDLNQRHGLAVILISHDLGVIADICSRVVVMRQGEIVEQGPTGQVVGDPQHAYTKLLIDSQPSRRASRGWRVETKSAETSPFLAVEKLSVSFPVKRGLVAGLLNRGEATFLALDKADIRVAQGETVGIVGESGSGKSTLARAITRLNQPSGGAVKLGGEDVLGLAGEGLTRFRRRVQMVFQNPYDSLNPRLTVAEAIAEPIWRHGLASRREAAKQADDLLEMVELPHALRDRKPRQLSGGQCQRVGLARALALRPEMLIADEITSALDVTTQAQILDLLTRLKQERDLTLLYISHDLAVVSAFCQRVYVFKAGRIVESGAAQQVLTEPQHDYTRELVGAVMHLAPSSQKKGLEPDHAVG